MTSVPRVSVLTTCHNDGQYLPAALESALSQSVQDLEVIALDNASTDGSWLTMAAVGERDRRLHFLQGFDLLNYPRALNLLAGLARGEWLVVLNADDRLAPGAIATILAIAAENPSRNLIYSPWRWIGGRTDLYDFKPYTADQRMVYEHQIPGIRAVRRDLWDALGGEDEAIAVGADWDWAVRGAVRGLLRPYRHPEPLWLVRHHGEEGQKHRLSAQADRPALRAHMQRHFEMVDAEC